MPEKFLSITSRRDRLGAESSGSGGWFGEAKFAVVNRFSPVPPRADELSDMRADQVHDSANRGTAAPYTIDVISTEDGLLPLETDWNRLSETSSHPNAFMTYGWFRAWSRRLTADQGRAHLQPYVLAVRHEHSIVGIAPLVRRVVSRFGFRVRKLEFVGGHADYNDMVLGGDPAGQIKAVIDFLAETTGHWDLADLRNLRETGDTIAQIKDALARAGCLIGFCLRGNDIPMSRLAVHGRR